MEPIRLSARLRLWPWIWLRGAGFPAAAIQGLEAPLAADALKGLLDLESEYDLAIAFAINVLEPALESRSGSERKSFSKAILKLRSGKLPSTVDHLAEARPAIEAAHEVQTRLLKAQTIFAAAFAADEVQTHDVLVKTALSPLFREAVAWQNTSALRSGVDKILKGTGGKYQRLVANYLQRYCTKNDQIGFFGPIGWGHVVDSDAKISPGPALVSKRTVYFSYWAIDAIALLLSDDPVLKPFLRPRRSPSVAVQGRTLHYGINGTTELPHDIAWLLASSDGQQSAHDLAELACADPTLDFTDPTEVFDVLEQLQERQMLFWQIDVPSLSPDPEAYLRRELQSAGQAGRAGQDLLDRLEAKRADVVAAAGNPELIATALEALSTEFHELTGASATRNPGAAYGGRTPVYEDCVRDMELRLPQEIFKSIGPALTLILDSARWCSYEVATKYRRVFDQAFDELGGGSIRYAAFYDRVVDQMPTMSGDGGGLTEESLQELRQRWAKLLQLDCTQSEMRFKSSELSALVEAAFEAPGPGWPGARFHCPDLLLASSKLPTECSPEDLQVVLGEVHATTFSIFALCGARGWPDLDNAIAAYEADSPVHIEAVIPKSLAGRASGHSMSSRDFHVELGEACSMRARDQVIAASELYVERRDEGLVVCSKDKTLSFDIIAFYEYNLGHSIGSRFGIAPVMAHTPRIQIDNLVVARESWRFDSADLDAFASLPRGAEQFAAAGRWRKLHGLPRLLFAKASGERKPTYVDFDSPIIIEILSNQIRKSERVSFSEMLPSLDQCWLRDNDGNRYVSELRTVVVDDASWCGAKT